MLSVLKLTRMPRCFLDNFKYVSVCLKNSFFHFSNRFQFYYNGIIDEHINAKVIGQTVSIIIDRNMFLLFNIEAVFAQLISKRLLIDRF